jgi:hypothetical protein
VQPDAPLITFDPAAVDRVTIQDGSGTQVELVKGDGQWRLPSHFDFPASTAKVEALLKDLQGLRTRLPVSTSPEAFARHIAESSEKWARAVRASGAKID